MGGVAARVSWASKVTVAAAVPLALATETAIEYEPAGGVVPDSVPAGVMDTPAGRPVAENESGCCPVAPMVKSKGLPGLEAKMLPPVRRGIAGGGAVEMVTVVCAA
jgi:hypothetical protein